MREENLRFMQYCAYNRKEEADREKELERVVNEEVEKKWAQTMQQYKLERDARQKLLANVMESRKQQIGVQSKLNYSCSQSSVLLYTVYFSVSVILVTVLFKYIVQGYQHEKLALTTMYLSIHIKGEAKLRD